MYVCKIYEIYTLFEVTLSISVSDTHFYKMPTAQQVYIASYKII